MNATRAPVTRFSIQKRLTRSLMLVSVLWSVGVCVLLTTVVHRQVDALLDGALQESAEILYGLLLEQPAAPPSGSSKVLAAPPHHERVVWQVVMADGHVSWRSHGAPDQPFAQVDAIHPAFGEDSDWRTYQMPLPNSGARLVVAQTHHERALAQWALGVSTILATMLVGAGMAWWLRHLVRQVLAPIGRFSEGVIRFDPLRRDAGLSPSECDELQPVQAAVLDLGQRLSKVVALERAVAAHAAHALRTPLAGMSAQLAAAQRELPESAARRLQLLRQSSLRLERVVSAVLALFRTQGEARCRTWDVRSVLEDLPIAPLTLSFEVGPERSADAELDADLLAAACLNLADNSLRFGATSWRIGLREEAGDMCLRIADDGPGVPAERRESLRQALLAQSGATLGERDVVHAGRAGQGADASRSGQGPLPGTGLGLILAAQVAALHGGSFDLPEPGAEEGFVVCFRWPVRRT